MEPPRNDCRDVPRGRCAFEGCKCKEFVRAAGVKCFDCKHVPIFHQDLIHHLESPKIEPQKKKKGICIYHNCDKKIYLQSNFCSKSHLEKYKQLEEERKKKAFPSRYDPYQCKFPQCTKHPLLPSNAYFCSLKHQQQYEQLPNCSCQNPPCENKVLELKNYCHLHQSRKHPEKPKKCLLKMCKKQQSLDEENHPREYCSKEHALIGEFPERFFFPDQTTTVELKRGNPKFSEIEKQFLDQWKFKIFPTVEKIIRFEHTKERWEIYHQYKLKILEKRLHLLHGGKGKGGPANEQRRFHGTGQLCKIGRDTKDLCTDTKCGICNITKKGFDLSKASSGGNFGPGLYFTATSSKSHSYNINSDVGAKFKEFKGMRSVLICLVILGNTKNETDLKGHKKVPDDSIIDSVIADPTAEKTKIKNDEAIVYKAEAALPRYLIVYH